MDRSTWFERRRNVRRVGLYPPMLVASLVLVLCQALPATASTTVGLWHMDETSGTTASDSSGFQNDGSLTDVTFVSPGFDGTGGAYSFNGTSSKVKIPNSTSLNPGSQDVTVQVHVRFTALPGAVGDYDLVRKAGSGSFYKIEISGKGQAVCLFKGTIAKGKVAFGPALNDGLWHEIICTKTSGSVTATVDGQSSSGAFTVGSISNSVPLVLSGKKTGTDDLYNGVMDEVTIGIG